MVAKGKGKVKNNGKDKPNGKWQRIPSRIRSKVKGEEMEKDGKKTRVCLFSKFESLLFHILLSDPKLTAKLYCISLSIDLRYT